MGSKKVYATVAGFLALASSVSMARAADLLSPPPPPPPPVVAAPDFGGGWYLRGDVGVSKYDAGRVSHPVRGDIAIYDKDFGSGAFAGVGAGYRFNSWFRADVTAEYRFSTGMSWRDKGPVSTGFGYYYNTDGFGHVAYQNGRASGTSYEKTKSGHSAAVVLVNGYVDLGNWYGITPFVGAGVGYANHFLRGGQTDTVNNYNTYTPDGGVPGPTTMVPSGIAGGRLINKDKGNFAWALHAGLAYDVTPGVKLELAYRYLNMGSISTGAIDCYCTAPLGQGFRVKDIDSHDVKIGMRWELGGPIAAPSYEPAPLMRKY